MTGRILLVDDDRVFRLTTAALLEDEGYQVSTAANGQEAADALAAGSFDLIVMDVKMPGIDGIALVEVLRTRGEGAPILMISGFGTVDSAVKALHAGADDFLTKPVEPDVLLGKVESLLVTRPTLSDSGPPMGIVGRSALILRVVEEVKSVAPSDVTVLVSGETGTGKELVARAIHARSNRADGPFVAVNCAALSEGLLDSELFGHVRGAFTGAVRDRDGLFAAADGGTLFLDEIGDVSPATQQRLLRALQEGEVIPVGSVKPIHVDARVVAATNRDLEASVADGSFREDLYYRLNVFRIDVPPLRERRSDIPLLVEHYLRVAPDDDSSTGAALVSPLALRIMLGYVWPGNVRHLFSVLESSRVRSGDGPIQAQHLPPELRDPEGLGDGASGAGRYRIDGEVDEREVILEALRQADGVRTRAATLLGMGRTTLWRKLKELGIEA